MLEPDKYYKNRYTGNIMYLERIYDGAHRPNHYKYRPIVELRNSPKYLDMPWEDQWIELTEAELLALRL